MEQSLNLINDFLDKLFIYGPFWIYLALLGASFVENVFPPFPGDFFTIAAGALAAAGRLNIYVVFLLVYLGGISSVMVLYYLGSTYGREFFLRKNYRIFSASDILRLEKWFQKKGVTLLIFNRFIVGARSAVALVTGISHYSPLKTFLSVSVSFWLFNGLLLFSSYIFVVNFDTIAEYYHMYEKVVVPIILLIVLVLIGLKIYRIRKDEV
jgi:membrane protein DedA with SNARE-associated domain